MYRAIMSIKNVRTTIQWSLRKARVIACKALSRIEGSFGWDCRYTYNTSTSNTARIYTVAETKPNLPNKQWRDLETYNAHGRQRTQEVAWAALAQGDAQYISPWSIDWWSIDLKSAVLLQIEMVHVYIEVQIHLFREYLDLHTGSIMICI
jgi:hypothetical protein